MNIKSNKLASFIKPILLGDSEEDEEPPLVSIQELQLKVKSFQIEGVSSIKTPRTKMVTVNQNDSIGQAVDIVLHSGFSKLPVINKDKDNIIGVIYTKDILKKMKEDINTPISSIIHPPYFVTYSLSVIRLINFFCNNKTTIAFVIDEFGGVDGLVTLNDINWELFGKIQDKFDIDEGPKMVIENNKAVFDGDYDFEDFVQLYKTDFDDNDKSETLGGFICDYLGHIPSHGEKFTVGGLQFTVLGANERKIDKISVEKLKNLPT